MRWGCDALLESMGRDPAVPVGYRDSVSRLNAILEGVSVQTPSDRILQRLPRGGAWTGYRTALAEVRRLAALAGLLEHSSASSCAFSLRSEHLFEQMVVRLASSWACRSGYSVRADFTGTSRIPLWSVIRGGKPYPPQSSLKPDVVLLSDDTVIIIDAKYKNLYDEQPRGDSSRDKRRRETVRADLQQTMAYGAGFSQPRKIFLISHPSRSDPARGSGLYLWKVGGGADSWFGLLPVRVGDTNLQAVEDGYAAGLWEALEPNA
jgi:hypothetical protein